MIIRILGNDYLVLYTISKNRELEQYRCRRIGEAGEREYRALRISSSAVRPELISYLMEQVHNQSFYEFVDYTTESDFLTVLMDCGQGISMARVLLGEKPSLTQRLAMGRKLLEHMLLSDFPTYFIYAAMGVERIKVSPAMDFGFDFNFSDFLQFESVDFSMASRKLGDVFEILFLAEQKQRAIPELGRLLYGLQHNQYSQLLPIYQEMEAICRNWEGKDEKELENHSFTFRLWEKIKGFGRFFLGLAKLAVILAAAAYLALSIYDFVQPEAPGQVYEQIGDLEIQQ